MQSKNRQKTTEQLVYPPLSLMENIASGAGMKAGEDGLFEVVNLPH